MLVFFLNLKLCTVYTFMIPRTQCVLYAYMFLYIYVYIHLRRPQTNIKKSSLSKNVEHTANINNIYEHRGSGGGVIYYIYTQTWRLQ